MMTNDRQYKLDSLQKLYNQLNRKILYLRNSKITAIDPNAIFSIDTQLEELQAEVEKVKLEIEQLEKAPGETQQLQDTTANISIPLTNILHLSDLHFGTTDDAYNWYDTLAQDLHYELRCDQLEAVILSGDIANKSTPEEYFAAKQFINDLGNEFQLEPHQVIIVPGNHDLNWGISETAYSLQRRKEYTGLLDENHIID
ncbi:MAG: metallophosphoesterase [Rivularia sp. (in: cyanobacteria)]